MIVIKIVVKLLMLKIRNAIKDSNYSNQCLQEHEVTKSLSNFIIKNHKKGYLVLKH